MTKKEVVTSYDEQIDRWVAGDSLHLNHDGLSEECCPDFSCCDPKLLQPVEVRWAFREANERQRSKLLMVFVAGLIAGSFPDVNAHITDGDPSQES